MNRSLTPWFEALLGVAAIAWLTSVLLPSLGLASAALLFLLPVLMGATRGGLGPGLFAALAGAGAYNYFLIEPRYTFRIHQPDNLVSVFVLVAVALVTSRLATRLMAREAEALDRAHASEELAALSAVLASGAPELGLARGLDSLSARYGEVRLLDEPVLAQSDAGLSSLDRSAAAWAIHNGDTTGHGAAIMPAADWTFVPLGPKNAHDAAIAAIARPADGRIRNAAQLRQLGQLCRLLGQSRDRVTLEAERRERESLEERERLSRTFLASLAHDFRTPLTVIAGQLELLAPQSPEARDALLASQRLERMMADLLGAARLESGALAPAMEQIDLVDAVSAACEGLVRVPTISLERAIPADLPFIAADPVLLHHVLVNLLINAQAHAGSRVSITASAGEGDIRLCVDDDGPGIAEAERSRVFERFVRIEGGDRTNGSGLGLAIVRGFAEAMGMTVTIATAPSGGASFILAMPITKAPR